MASCLENRIVKSNINKALLILVLFNLTDRVITEVKTLLNDTGSATADYDFKRNVNNRARSVPGTVIRKSFDAKMEDSTKQRLPRGFADTLKNKWSSLKGENSDSSEGGPEGLKNMWKKMKGKKITNVEWDLSREEAAEVYQQYYKCQKQKYEALHEFEKGKLKPIHAVMALEGERVILKCQVCARPDQDKMAQQAVWQHLRRSDSSLEPLLGSNPRMKQAEQGSLSIHNLQQEDAGQYTCLDKDGEYVAIYQLDVKFRERRKMIKEGDPVLNTTFLEDHNVKLLTTWSQWGPCDSCDFEGSKQQHGTCVVKKINDTDPVKPKDFPMMVLYPEGVPCHSTALPPRIRLLKEVRQRYEETLVSRCIQACPTEAPPVVITDKDGKEVEVLPPGKFYNLNEKVPMPIMVKRRVVYEPEGKHLILACSDVDKEAGVRWMRGKRPVDPLSIKRQTAGRVWVDSANRLHIGLLLLSDTAVYNCWERKRHVVAIKVLVVDGFSERMKLYITYGSFGMTIFVSVIAFCCICVCGKGKGKGKGP